MYNKACIREIIIMYCIIIWSAYADNSYWLLFIIITFQLLSLLSWVINNQSVVIMYTSLFILKSIYNR